MSEQDEIDTLATRMKYLGIEGYEVRTVHASVVYWRGQEIGGVPYLNSRSMDQLARIMDRARADAEKGEQQG